ncbi:MAG TPA: hypothetical protein VGR29_00465 [Thermomicrobiales bacterium]|nr:hypothetical protein [Thermomicrobiales bacterium]
MPEPGDQPVDDSGRVEGRVWLVLLLAMCLWAAWRIGAFDLTNIVTIQGREIEVPNVYAWVDHPFHATRAHLLLESLKEGDLLRWVGNHQGGYPVEFYPLGIPWLDVALWALFLGTMPIIALHKLAVVAVFLLPAVSYWVLARGDRIHPGVALLATALHFAVPGHWLNGGYTELVGWGLVTNVAGGSLALLASAALARFVVRREHAMGVLAVLAAAAGACTNPRSLFAVVIAAIAILATVTAAGDRQQAKARFTDAVSRIGLVGVLALLLAMPVVLALFRYNAEYFFLHYEFYEPVTELWTASMSAVSLPVLIMAIIGTGVAILGRPCTVAQSLAVTLVAYVLFTMAVAASSWVPPLVEQLEAPRLMPYQRQLTMYFGAWALGAGLQKISQQIPVWKRAYASSAVIMVVAVAALVIFVRPASFVPENFHGLTPVDTTGDDDFPLFMEAIEEAESEREEGTSIFVVGNREDRAYWWHQQLWAPVASPGPFYYDDWLWYWHRDHRGPYDYRNGYSFPNPGDALTAEYLRNNGISVVVVTDMSVPSGPSPRMAARTSPALALDTTIGQWEIYSVVDPTSIVSNGDSMPEDTEIDNGDIVARFDDGGGTVVVRQNWFPRWEAFASGEKVDITRRDDGYMELNVPPGPVSIELRYGVTLLDWVGRIAAIAGVAGTVGFTIRGRHLFARRRG